MKLLLVVAAALVDSDNRVLIAQRPEGKALAGLWEFPSYVLGPEEPSRKEQQRVLQDLAALLESGWLESNHCSAPRSGAAEGGACKKGGPDSRKPVEKKGIRNSELTETRGPEASRILTREVYLGEVVHVFSHIRQHMLVHHLTVEEHSMGTGMNGKRLPGQRSAKGRGGGGEGSVGWQQAKWCGREEIETAGLSRGVRKVRKVLSIALTPYVRTPLLEGRPLKEVVGLRPLKGRKRNKDKKP